MKNIFTLIVIIFTSVSIIGQTLPNAGFETWEEKTVLLTTFEDPVSWNTPNEFTALGGTVVVTKSDDAPEGNFSVEMTSKEIPPTSFRAPGLVTLADFTVDFETTDFAFSGGLYLKARVFSLSGKYKFSGKENDSATALIYSFRHPDGGAVDTIGVGLLYLKDASEWTDFTVNMLNLSPTLPDTFNVLLMGAGSFDPASIPAGSVMHIDDLSIETNVGVFELPERLIDVKTFPNPAAEVITFETAENSKGRQILIMDQQGRKIREIGFNETRVTIKVSDLAPGIYSYLAREGDRLVGSGSFIVD